jgi:hypothetical protein
MIWDWVFGHLDFYHIVFNVPTIERFDFNNAFHVRDRAGQNEIPVRTAVLRKHQILVFFFPNEIHMKEEEDLNEGPYPRVVPKPKREGVEHLE